MPDMNDEAEVRRYNAELQKRVAELEDAITKRQQAEEKLYFLNQVSRQVVSSIITTNTNFEINWTNPAFEKLYGYTQEEIIGRTPDFLNAAPNSEEIQKDIYQTVSSGKIWRGEFRNKKKDGSIFPCEMEVSPLINEKGEIFAYCSQQRDITQRKIAEEELKLKNIILFTQQETSLDGILVVDDVGKMISLNNRFIAMWGISSDIIESRSDEEALKSVLDKIVGPDKFLKRVKYLYANPDQKSREEIALRDGRTFDRYSAPMIGPDGKYYGRVWYFRNITDQKRAIKERHELELKALEQAELAALGQIAAGIAHEINQPLSFIRVCYQSTLRDFELKNIDPKKLITDFQEALRQVGRISEIISHLRTFGRNDAYPLNKLQLPAILDNTLLLLGQRLRLNNIKLTSDIEEKLPCVYGNNMKLEQVFINLTQNSIDALEQSNRGEITVIMRRDADKVLISFLDNGAGIDPEVIGKIFEPFFSTKEVGRGTGLGLSLVYGIIKEHNGTIDCKSELGKGTMIVITLPAAL